MMTIRPHNIKLRLDLIKQMVYYIDMDTFSALADPSRRRIIELIATSGRLSASDISKRFDISPPAISQHLKVLREAKLVDMEKKAQQRIYSLNADSLSRIETWIKKLRNILEERYQRLDDLLKKGGEKT